MLIYIMVGIVFGVAAFGIATALRVDVTIVAIIASGIGGLLAGFVPVKIRRDAD